MSSACLNHPFLSCAPIQSQRALSVRLVLGRSGRVMCASSRLLCSDTSEHPRGRVQPKRAGTKRKENAPATHIHAQWHRQQPYPRLLVSPTDLPLPLDPDGTLTDPDPDCDPDATLLIPLAPPSAAHFCKPHLSQTVRCTFGGTTHIPPMAQ